MLSFFGKIFRKKTEVKEQIDPMKKFLIVGLGNIGPEYEETRHNIGFKILDHLAKKEDLTFETQKLGAIRFIFHCT